MSPRRILIHGATGSGKSTAATRIGQQLGLPVRYVDEAMWLPGWRAIDTADQRSWAVRTCSADEWVLDSSWSTWTDVPLARCDIVVGLDYPRWLSFGRLVRRTVSRVITRESVCNGNVETWRNIVGRESILWWHVHSFGNKRQAMRRWAVDQHGPPVLLFDRPRDLTDWITTI